MDVFGVVDFLGVVGFLVVDFLGVVGFFVVHFFFLELLSLSSSQSSSFCGVCVGFAVVLAFLFIRTGTFLFDIARGDANTPAMIKNGMQLV